MFGTNTHSKNHLISFNYESPICPTAVLDIICYEQLVLIPLVVLDKVPVYNRTLLSDGTQSDSSSYRSASS